MEKFFQKLFFAFTARVSQAIRTLSDVYYPMSLIAVAKLRIFPETLFPVCFAFLYFRISIHFPYNSKSENRFDFNQNYTLPHRNIPSHLIGTFRHTSSERSVTPHRNINHTAMKH